MRRVHRQGGALQSTLRGLHTKRAGLARFANWKASRSSSNPRGIGAAKSFSESLRTVMNVRPHIRRRGFTLIEFMFVVVALSVLVALYLPNLTRRRGCSGGISCVNNL